MFDIGYCKYTLCNTIAQLKLVSATCICRRRCFQLQQFLMKPFPYRNQNDQQRIFSYYLSQARRVIENTFGIMTHRFALLRKSMNLELKKQKRSFWQSQPFIIFQENKLAIHINHLDQWRQVFSQAGCSPVSLFPTRSFPRQLT